MSMSNVSLVLIIGLVSFGSAASDSEQDSSGHEHEKKDSDAYKVFNTYVSPISTYGKSNTNKSYFADNEYTLRVPDLHKNEVKFKRKPVKKTPKRTIQKIIKKSKAKSKKMFLNQMTSEQPRPSENVEAYEMAQEDLSQKHDSPTTRTPKRKRGRKWGTKHSRYPMPFQKLPRNDMKNKRHKRETTRDDLFILEDFDEIEFLSKEDGTDAVKAHVKKYW